MIFKNAYFSAELELEGEQDYHTWLESLEKFVWRNYNYVICFHE